MTLMSDHDKAMRELYAKLGVALAAFDATVDTYASRRAQVLDIARAISEASGGDVGADERAANGLEDVVLIRCAECGQVEPRHAGWCKHDSAG